MRHDLSYAGAAGAAAVTPELRARSGTEVARQFAFLLRVFTPLTVFMEVGSPDCDLAACAASYVERVWCVDSPPSFRRQPCNLRSTSLNGMAEGAVDVAFSTTLKDPGEMHRVLGTKGVYFVYGQLVPPHVFREAGFSSVRYFAGSRRVPAALARLSAFATTAAYK
jgi:hypothetical protein